jgi:hypothetical protein
MKDGAPATSRDTNRDLGTPRVGIMRNPIAAILWRNITRALLTFLAVALVTWLLAWYADRYRPGNVCGVKALDGSWQRPPCE